MGQHFECKRCHKEIDLHPICLDCEPVPTDALLDVIAERRRQIEAEGWTPEHDDQHGNGEMALAASVYAAHTSVQAAYEIGNFHIPFMSSVQEFVRRCWPWANKWWKPSGRRRNLVKAGALILAEIERIDRAAAKNPRA